MGGREKGGRGTLKGSRRNKFSNGTGGLCEFGLFFWKYGVTEGPPVNSGMPVIMGHRFSTFQPFSPGDGEFWKDGQGEGGSGGESPGYQGWGTKVQEVISTRNGAKRKSKGRGMAGVKVN